MEAQPGPQLDVDLRKFAAKAHDVQQLADLAFQSVATVGERIRAACIACAAIEATVVVNCSPDCHHATSYRPAAESLMRARTHQPISHPRTNRRAAA